MKTLTRDNLQIFILDKRDEMGEAAAQAGLMQLKILFERQQWVNIIFAAGPSQNELYRGLLKDPQIAWNRVNAFHMVNYVGLDDDAPQQFTSFLRERFFSKLPFASVFYMGNTAEDAADYEELLKIHTPDMCFMGVGENGHIAFNDPDNALFDDPQLIKLVTLDLPFRRQQVNEGNFESLDEVPTHALTLTIPTLMSCQHLICTVPGRSKAQAVKNMLEGEISEACPATILRRHPSAGLYLDKEAASLLTDSQQ